MTATTEFRVLGPVGAWRDGEELPMGGSKQRTVLAALLLAGGRVVSDGRLTRLLWDRDPPATASAQLYTYVSRLRHRLGPPVQVLRRQPGYLMDIGDARFDLTEFERLSADGRQALAAGDLARARQSLRGALTVWRGTGLGQATDTLAESELPIIEEARLATLECRIEAELALGEHHALVAELTGLVAAHPMRERFRAQLMTALQRSDRQSDALAVYQEGRRVLAEELGVDPGPALTTAHQAVLAGGSAWTEVRPAMVPPDLGDFVGRASLVATVATWRGGPVVLTGMAGAGKTALAVRAAHACRHEFPDGQLFAELGGSTDRPKEPGDVLGGFLRALGAPGETLPDAFDERLQLYRSRTADRRLLVVLDDAAGETQVQPLLPVGAHSQVLVTARTPLGMLPDARIRTVPMLDDTDAHAVLAAIAGATRLAAEPGATAYVVRRCAGLPLAVRIAGARLAANPLWPVAKLAEQLHNAGQLGELSPDDGGVRAGIEASYRRLSREARAAFRRLGRHGGVPPAESEELLEALVTAALLEVTGIEPGGTQQYRVHDHVLLFARELGHRLTVLPAVRPVRTAGQRRSLPM